LEFAPDFQETNVYEPNFATFFCDFHFITLMFARCADEFGCYFYLGLKIKCESRLEFVHPQKIKNKKTNDKTTEKACKIIFFTFFLGLWV